MAKQTNILGLLETRQNYHSTQSIMRWKQAINQFESTVQPSRVLLYDMYDDIMLDGQVEAVWGKRVDAVLNRRLIFKRDGKEDKEIGKLLNSPDMRGLIKELVNTILYGYTLIQVNSIYYSDEEECYRIDYDLIPRKHVHPEKGRECISKEQTSISSDFLYKQAPLCSYMIWAGEPCDKGLLVKAAPYVIYKRGSFGDWAQFSEMFGMPFREAIYSGFDDDTRKKVEEFLQQWSSSTYFVHDAQVEVKMHDTGSSASSSDIYDKFIKLCDAAISKSLLGNTLTTEQGDSGARSLGEVHENEEEEKKQSDDAFVLSVLNTQFRRVLKRFGINATNGEIWFESPGKDWTGLQTKWEVISGISAKVPVDDDYIYEEFDIPKPANYDQLKADAAARAKAIADAIAKKGGESNEPNEEEDTDDGKPKGKGKKLSARVADFFGVAPM